jgi:hypothetical protein
MGKLLLEPAPRPKDPEYKQTRLPELIPVARRKNFIVVIKI